MKRRSDKAAVRRSLCVYASMRLVVCPTPPLRFSPMDLGPVIRIIEKVPAALPAERRAKPAPPEPAPAEEPVAP